MKRVIGIVLGTATLLAVFAALASASTPIWGYCVLRAQVPQEVRGGVYVSSGSIDGCHSPSAILEVDVCLVNSAGSNIACSGYQINYNATSVSASTQAQTSGHLHTTSYGIVVTSGGGTHTAVYSSQIT